MARLRDAPNQAAVIVLWLGSCALAGFLGVGTLLVGCMEGENTSSRIADGSVAGAMCQSLRVAFPLGFAPFFWPALGSFLTGAVLLLGGRPLRWWWTVLPLVLWFLWTVTVILLRWAGSVPA